MARPKQTAQSQSLPVPIVALGASVGGLEAVSDLLTNLPTTTGFAYIYIQPLGNELPEAAKPNELTNPAGADSLLASLSQITAMPVVAVSDKQPVQPNHVYVILANGTVTVEIIDGILTESKRRLVGGPADEMPIDRFFMALADRQRDGAIAVLLSGTTSDGTLGLRAIRAAGGITFAQDETARFHSMPRSAITEGVVDKVLSPTDIARELERLSRKFDTFREATGADVLEKLGTDPAEAVPDDVKEGNIDGAPLASADLVALDSTGLSEGSTPGAWEQATEEDILTIIKLLRKATGTDFSHYKMTTIRRRIIRRMLLFKFETLKEYATYLRQHPDETRLLYDDLLINVTTFFRDADTMDYLQKVLFPQLVRSKVPHDSLRIWVPACSTGQEAYSIAILLLEALGDRVTSLNIQIFATDLSERAVAKARLGAYTRGEVMDVSPTRLKRFFTKVDDHYRINKTIRDLCVFAPHNLLKDPPFSRLDLVSCRNLLIYLDGQLQRKAIATFHYALNPTGYLLLGKSETVGPSSPFFSTVETNYKLYTRKNDVAGRALFEMNTRAALTRSTQLQPSPPDTGSPDASSETAGGQANQSTTGRTRLTQTARTMKSNRPVNNLDKAVDSLLNQYIPSSVVVNEDLDILQFRGSTGLFLEPSPGRASLNLLKMARPALTFELRNIVHKAGQLGTPVRRSGLEIKIKDKIQYVAIEAVPFSTDADERLYLIVFEEVTAIVAAENDAADARSRRIRQLEDELATLREDIRSLIEDQEAAHEEQQSANEEIISSNEELQSINEELETSKEEIESTNEELLTINQELQVRNDQLSEANAFAEVIFSTIREATLVLTPDLRVKSANSVFYTLFGLNESETEGRLIYEIAGRQWDIPQLRSLLTDVAIRDHYVQGFELSYQFPDVGQKILSLNARRVVRQQEAILLAIEDITEHRRSQRLIEEREAWFHQIADNAPTLIWVAGPSGQYTFLNKVWLEYTGYAEASTNPEGWLPMIHPDDRSNYEQTYQICLMGRQPFKIEYRLRRHDGEYHWMLESAQPIFAPDGSFTGFIGTGADVQGQKELNAELDRLVADRTSELTQTNARLVESKDQLQSVLNGVPASITLMEAVLPPDDPTAGPVDFTTAAFNQRAQELIGESPEAMRTRSILETNPEFRDNGLFDTFTSVYKTGQAAYREMAFVSQGQERCLAFYVTPQVDSRGVVVTALDITDRKEAEQQVHQTAEVLQAVLDSSPASIGMLKAIRADDNNRIVNFCVAAGNQRFAELVNFPIPELSDLSLDHLVQFLWQDDTLNRLAHVVETGEPFYVEQQNPTVGWLALSVTKQDDGVVITGLDITDLKLIQQQREELLNQVRQSSDTVSQLATLQQQVHARGELLRTSSHDLRGSLAVIQGAADLLNFADSDEERTQMLEMIQRNARETTRLITELLDLARLESGQQLVQIAPFDAAELLTKLGENVRPIVEGKGLYLSISGEDQLAVEGDSLNVLRIAQNIVLNAIKYTPEGGITLSWGSTEPNEWYVSIQDTGPGMDQALVSRLTAPTDPVDINEQVNADVSQSVESFLSNKHPLASTPGEGIGLFIVRQLCILLSGRLFVESHPDQGSVFRIVLPRNYPTTNRNT
jgi:two-component system CheB/CheR fusion protein